MARALRIAFLTLAAYAVLWGCGGSWHVKAHAAINGRAYALAALDASLARAMGPVPPAEAVARFTGPVRALRAFRNHLASAEAAVDGAERIGDAPARCRAWRVLVESGPVTAALAVEFASVGLPVPAEVPQTVTALAAAAEPLAGSCEVTP
jgi:hypothetical protein